MAASIRLRDLAGDLRALPETSMVAAAKAVKKIAAEEATRAGAPLRKGRRKIKLQARDEIKSSGGVTVCTVRGFPVGPWIWITDGTSPHQIPRKRKRPRKGKPRYLGLPGHPVMAPPVVIHHPGTSGKDAWRKVRRRAEAVVPEIFRDDVHKLVRG